MRRINGSFAAILFLATAVSAGAFHYLHIIQYDRIAQSLLWQVEKAREDGKSDQAIKFASQYLHFRPNDVAVMNDLAVWLSGRAKDYRQWQGVANMYERILRVTPGDAETRLKAATLYSRLQNFAAALDHLAILKQSTKPDAKLLTLLGYCQAAVGKNDLAAESYRAAMTEAPNEAAAFINYAALLQTHFNRPPAEIESALDGALKANPKSASAHAARAQFLKKQGRVVEATREIELARSLEENDPAVILAAAEIAQTTGDLRRAAELLAEGANLHPTNPRFACGLAWLQIGEGQNGKALETLREARKLHPKDPDVLTLLGDVYAEDGQIDPLKDTIKELNAIKASPDRLQYLEARWQMRRGRWADAAAALEKLRTAALKTPALYRQTNHYLAQVCEQLGDEKRELESYRRMLDGEPNLHGFRLEYSQALARAGRIDDALREFQTALRPETAPRAIADAARVICRVAASSPASLSAVERAFEGLKLDDTNPNPTLARAELDLARHKPGDSLAQVVRVLNKQPAIVVLHSARVRLVDQQFGTDRALAALDEAERYLGRQADFMVLRARLLARSSNRSVASSLTALAENLDKFSSDDQIRIRRELACGLRISGEPAAARQMLQAIADARPDHLPSRESLALLALRDGDEATRRKLLDQMEAIEGKDGPARLQHESAALLSSPTDENLKTASAKLELAAQQRGRDPIVEFLRGRVEELGGNADAARSRYLVSLSAGLLERPPVEELLQCQKGSVNVLRQLLLDRLSADESPSVLIAAAPIFDSASREQLSQRLKSCVPANEPARLQALGNLLAKLGCENQAAELLQVAATSNPRSLESWQAAITDCARRQDTGELVKIMAVVRQTLPGVEGSLAIGRGLEAGGKRSEARQEYETALKSQPDDPRLLHALANLLIESGQLAEAQKCLQVLAALPTAGPGAEDVRWGRRTLAIQYATAPSLVNFHKSLNLLDANGAASDEDVRARVIVLASQKSRTIEASGRTARQEAIRLLELLQQKPGVRSSDDLIQLARLYRAEGDDAKASALRDRLRTEFASHYGSIAFLARELLRSQSFAECEKLIPRLRQLGGNFFETYIIEFQYFTLSGDSQKGRERLTEYLNASPTPEAKAQRLLRVAELVYDFTEAYPLTDRQAEAQALREFAIESFNAGGTLAADNLAKVVTLMARAGQTAPALALLQRSKESQPAEAIAAAQVSVLRHGQPTPQQVKATENYLADLIHDQPQSTSLQLSLAEFYEVTQATEKALAQYRAVLAREPENVLALNNLAWLLSSKPTGLQEALAMVDRAIDQIGPADELLDTRSRIRFETGRTNEGIRDLADAVSEAPTATRYQDLAALYRRAGKTDKAEQTLALARRLGAK